MSKPFTSPEYDRLPESIKAQMTEKEFCWLSDAEKRNITDEFTMPEATDD